MSNKNRRKQKKKNNAHINKSDEKISLFKEYGLCGITNYGYNCYLNSGLQIISRCDIFIKWLNESKYPSNQCPRFYLFKKTINEILNLTYFDPKEFISFLCFIFIV